MLGAIIATAGGEMTSEKASQCALKNGGGGARRSEISKPKLASICFFERRKHRRPRRACAAAETNQASETPSRGVSCGGLFFHLPIKGGERNRPGAVAQKIMPASPA